MNAGRRRWPGRRERGPPASIAARRACVRWYESHGRNVPATCVRCNITPEVLSQWLRRYRASLHYGAPQASSCPEDEAARAVREVERLLAGQAPHGPGRSVLR